MIAKADLRKSQIDKPKGRGNVRGYKDKKC